MNQLLAHAEHTGTSVARFATSGCTVVDVSYLPGHSSESHAHESPFIHAVLGGDALQKAPESAVLARGDVCFYPAGRHHSHAVQNTGWRALAIDIRPVFAASFVEHGADFTRPVVVSDPDVFRAVTRLQREIRDPDPLSNFQVEALIVDICVSFMRLSRDERWVSAPGWLQEIVTTLEGRYRETFSLNTLASEVKVHPVHVARAFRRRYGETPGDFVRRLRIKEARRLIESGSASIAEIAAEVGYHDESHLARAFRQVVGTTPGRYRRVVRSGPKITT